MKNNNFSLGGAEDAQVHERAKGQEGEQGRKDFLPHQDQERTATRRQMVKTSSKLDQQSGDFDNACLITFLFAFLKKLIGYYSQGEYHCMADLMFDWFGFDQTS